MPSPQHDYKKAVAILSTPFTNIYSLAGRRNNAIIMPISHDKVRDRTVVLNSLNAAPLVSPLDDFTEEDLPLTWKTKTIKRLDPHTYVFYCTTRLTTARINKNMIVIETKGELSVINPLKLTGEGQRKLGNLGKIKNIIRLGYSLHGIFEDLYYLQEHPKANSRARVLQAHSPVS